VASQAWQGPAGPGRGIRRGSPRLPSTVAARPASLIRHFEGLCRVQCRRTWPYSPPAGFWAWAQAFAALAAPVVFLLASCSAVGQVRAQRRTRLSDPHPGVQALLPGKVSIRVHHRAWSRCEVAAVGDRGRLDTLLQESSPGLGPDAQPRLDVLWARVQQSRLRNGGRRSKRCQGQVRLLLCLSAEGRDCVPHTLWADNGGEPDSARGPCHFCRQRCRNLHFAHLGTGC
jgi:hypothetical protein